MFVILVYDTAVERNPAVLRICRKYLHWTQRSVFQGELTHAQYRRLTDTLKAIMDDEYDSIRIYRTRDPALIEIDHLGALLGNDDSIL